MNVTTPAAEEEAASLFEVLPEATAALLLSGGIALSLSAAYWLYRKRRELNTPQAIV